MLVMSVEQPRADRRGRGVLASPIVVARVSPSRAWMSALGCLKCTEVLRDREPVVAGRERRLKIGKNRRASASFQVAPGSWAVPTDLHQRR